MIYSFDIFDTCLVRKCGDAKNLFDVLAYRAFVKPVSENDRKEFIYSRLQAEADTYSPSQTLQDIYNAFQMRHIMLHTTEELIQIEEQCESELLVPVYSMSEMIKSLRAEGHQIVYISDMYLRAQFLKSILVKYGFYQEGDFLFVSCEYNSTKANGALYEVVKKELGLSSFRNWHHYGDNEISDVKVPNRLGVSAHRVNHTYTPYQKEMLDLPDLKYQWAGMLAGLSRSIRYQYENNQHYDFFLDIILPLYVTFTIRVMNNAVDSGIRRLYFCARDTYLSFKIAKHLQKEYPSLDVVYFYVSRQSLYEGEEHNKLAYFKQIGLASVDGNNAIVDIRSSGKTLLVLNDILERNGCKKVKGYFFELFPNDINCYAKLGDYYSEIINPYISQISHPIKKIPSNWYLYELFFPLNTQKRTIGYAKEKDGYVPVLDEVDKKEYKIDELVNYVSWRECALVQFINGIIEMGLCEYADDVFERYAIPQLARFINLPNKHYLKALGELYVVVGGGRLSPYVENAIWRLPLNLIEHRTVWKRGTIVYSLPTFVSTLLFRKRK